MRTIDEQPAVPDDALTLRRYVSDLALDALRSGSGSSRFEVEGSLAFFDLTGFTPLTERLATLGRPGAEYITDVVNALFTALIAIVFAGGGDVLEFGGDAMLVLFRGADHQRRAAAAGAEVMRFMQRHGRVSTPAGTVRVRMSCGMASGTQAFYLAGTKRRALLVAGPVSTAMARLEQRAEAGEVRVDANMAAALPPTWYTPESDGTALLRNGFARSNAAAVPRPAGRDGDAEAAAQLIPVALRPSAEGRRGEGELKQIAVAFVRLRGTDELLTREGADALLRRLGEVTEVIESTADELGVCWLETQAEADAVRWIVVTGVPDATEQDPDRLVTALCRIVERCPHPLSIGANLGVVFVGELGHPERCTVSVIGDATNLAARLMSRAATSEIIVGERLFEALREPFDNEPLEPFHVKGKRSPQRARRVRRALGQHGLVVTRDSAAPLVGRDADLQALLDLLQRNALIDLCADAGLGKTRLWNEARQRVSARRWFVTASHPVGAASPYLAFRPLLRELAGIPALADPEAAGQRLVAFVIDAAPRLQPMLPLLADVVGAVVEQTPEVAGLDPAFRNDRLRLAVAELMTIALPLDSVLVFDDVHWMDDESKALLETVAPLLSGSHAVITTRRPDGWTPAGATTIELQPITEADAEALLLHSVDEASASDATLARLSATAGGNPLYLIELARSGSDGSDLPDSIDRLLAARVDRLPRGDRELIRDLAILGSPVNREFAAEVIGDPQLVGPNKWLDAGGDLITVVGDTVDFRHDLVRVAAYEGSSERRRRAVHRRAGDVLEALGDGAPVPDVLGALAFHATGSRLPERIARWNRLAGEAAAAKGAMATAETLLEQAAAAMRQLDLPPSERIAVLRQLATAAERAGHPGKAVDALTDARRLAEADERRRIAVDIARVQEKRGRYRQALALTARALNTCTDEGARRHLLLARASVRNYLGQWRACLTLCHELLDDVSVGDDPQLVAQAHLLAEWCCACLGLPQRATHEAKAYEILTQLDDSIGLGNLLLNRGVSAWQENRVVDAITDFRTSSERYGRAGDVLGAALADNNLAEILTIQWHLDDAEALLRRAQRVMRAASYPLGATGTVSGLARIAAWRGRLDEALDLQSAALAGFRRLGAEDQVADALVRMAEVHVLRDEATLALRFCAEADDVLARLPDVTVVPAAQQRWKARALLLIGDVQSARAAFAAALDKAHADDSRYEAALASMGLARIDGDNAAIDGALRALAELDVLAPPPGS